MSPVLDVPAALRQLAATLQQSGGRVWLVGGAVRDALLAEAATPDADRAEAGVERDWDLATDLPPDAVAAAIGTAPQRAHAFGAVAFERDGVAGVVQTLRRESGYRDRRRPDVVEFTADLAADAARRDFTANALYLDLSDGRLIDPLGGREDLRRGVLRAIGDPSVRLREDPLRMLRAVRFCAAGGLRLEAATDAALRAHSDAVRDLSADRVRDELTRAFTGRGRGRALRMAIDLGVTTPWLPELAPMDGVPQPPQYHPEGDVLTHVCLVLDHVPADDPVLSWAAVLHDVGKPPTFERAADRIRFTGHDVLSAQMAERMLRRLRAPRRWIEAVVEICRDHIRIASLPQMGKTKRERWLRTELFPAHLAFHRADCLGSHGDLHIYEFARRALAELPPEPPPPLVSGADVLALGVGEGPMVGQLLRAAQAEIEQRAGVDRRQALSILETVVKSAVKEPAGGADTEGTGQARTDADDEQRPQS